LPIRIINVVDLGQCLLITIDHAIAIQIGTEEQGRCNIAYEQQLFDRAQRAVVGRIRVRQGRVVFAFGAHIAGLVIGVLVMVSTFGVLRETVGVLLEGAPAGMDAREVGAAIASTPGVVGVHDLHLWTITSGFPALSAHVLVAAGADCHAIRREVDELLRERFQVTHTTLQVEHAPGLIKLAR